MATNFRVGLTHDFLKSDGTFGFGDVGLDSLNTLPGLKWEVLPDLGPELPASLNADFDALLVLAPKVTRQTVSAADRLLLVARFGVGYDNVDVPACTEQGVLLTITPDGVRRPVAASAVALLLALSHKMLIKDRLTREGRWHEKLDYPGIGTTGRTLGIIGLGNIGREIVHLLLPFQMRFVACDPFVPPVEATALGVELLEIKDVMSRSDYVVVCCNLSKETHHLVGVAELARMKPTAFLINVARGPIVDQAALTESLRTRAIQGAGLDVFEQEPISPDDPLLRLDNVILAPHALSWTDECFLNVGRSACRGIVDVAQGKIPQFVVNPAVLQHGRLSGRFSSRS